MARLASSGVGALHQAAPSALDMTLGRNIAASRMLRGLSQRELARCASIGEQRLLSYEAGARRIPRSDLIRIIEVCDVSVGSMFAG